MNAFLIAFRAVFPPTLLIAIGYISRLAGYVKENEAYRFNKLCYNTLITAVVFHNIYNAEITAKDCAPLLAFCVLGVMAECFLATTLFRRVEPAGSRAMASAAARDWVCQISMGSCSTQPAWG